MIRAEQTHIAREMILPYSAENSVMQLNMGEGKSSVIIPLVAATIADGTRLARVMVLKALAKQMMDILSQRLSGLAHRKLYFLPFHRKRPLDETMLNLLVHLWQECLESRSILLVQPEHMLSLKLMGQDRLASHPALGLKLMNAFKWLRSVSRDILDESDQILDAKYQLVYTIGTQQAMDCQPQRWTLIQDIFGLIEKHATQIVASSGSEAIELESRTEASFPFLRFLRKEIWDSLISALVEDILEGCLPGLSFNTNASSRILAHKFMQSAAIDSIEWNKALERFSANTLQYLLLVRGLVIHNVLYFALCRKRWLVDYGLDAERCMMAVPYLAKGVPSPSAEFGHPDVALSLTCLSYYYTGLSESQVRETFELLFKTPDPSHGYARWLQRSPSVPRSLRTLNNVNLEDREQFSKILFPSLKFNKYVIDTYLASVVFPSEGKEFPKKLATSAWDIPSEPGLPLTTGFSGTNDNRYTLPRSIAQRDLPEFHHTNAMVFATS